MPLVYFVVASIVALGRVAVAVPEGNYPSFDARPAQEVTESGGPVVNPTDADGEYETARRIARNQRRSDIINQFMRKRNTPENVSAYVSSLTFWNSPFESTILALYRGFEAGKRSMPFGGGNYYHGLTPNFIEFKLKDNQKIDEVAHCVLDFFTSRMNPSRIFFRTRKCFEDPKLAHWADRRGFNFAGLVELREGQVDRYRDLTETDLLIDDRRLRFVLDDPDAFGPRASEVPASGEPTGGPPETPSEAPAEPAPAAPATPVAP